MGRVVGILEDLRAWKGTDDWDGILSTFLNMHGWMDEKMGCFKEFFFWYNGHRRI